jgi:hypothetical protein
MTTPFRYYIARPKKSQAPSHTPSEQMFGNHPTARQIEEGKKGYELKKERRLIMGLAQEGPNKEHELRMYKVERVLDARCIDLQKLAVWQNKSEAATTAEERADHHKVWEELVREIEPHLLSQHRQLQQME